MALVLASASPRRLELLGNAGIGFVVQPANITEVQLANETPQAFAERMAMEKARTVWNSLANPHFSKNARSGAPMVLGADTVVVLRDHVLGKPADHDDATRMLRLLSGKKHSVITGVCLLGGDFEDVRSEMTSVYFSALSESEITNYIESGEPMDKAGAYAIQGMAAKWILKIEGDYSNVVGLPVDLVKRMLQEHGIT
jgi:septum formation protein